MYSKKIVLHFPSNLVNRPIIYKLSKDFNLEFNILKALVNPDEEGLMVLELKGEKDEYNRAVKYLEKEKVRTQILSKDVTRDEDKCVDCGLCVAICPVEAFEVDPDSREIEFHDDKCIACEMCVKVCPYKAMEVNF